jgi:large subunit ribosomal protein L2
MGKRIISRARGAGGPRYRVPSHRYKGKPSYDFRGLAKVIDIIHDPARDSPLAVVLTKERLKKFIIPAEGLKVGDEISIGEGSTNTGNILPLSSAPKGAFVFAIEKNPGSGPKFCNGTKAIVTGQEENKVILQMPSLKFKDFNPRCLATIGVPAGGGRRDKPFVKAGQNFYKARARNRLWPRSSAVKMNPVDHPFGGHTKPGTPKTISRWAPPGAKVGSIAAKRSGLRKK